jgi:uncharacterized phage-associated protein
MGTTVVSAANVAKYFLILQDEEDGDTISNLKLQKLLYYAQGYYLALFDQPLFPDRMEAWQHGPVVPSVYHEYKIYGAQALPRPVDWDLAEVFRDTTRDFLDEIYRLFGQFSAWKLRKMTHDEAPWVDAIGRADSTITIEALKAYFETQVTQ